MKKSARLSLVIMLPVLLIAGCLNYEQVVKLDSDSSGSMEIHYWTSEDNVQWMSNDNFSFQETEIKDRYKGSGITVEEVKVETNPTDSTRHVRVELSFKDINKLSETPAFKNTAISFVKEGENFLFKQSIKGSSNADGMGMNEYTFRYSYTFPGDVLSSNADKTEGRTLEWVYKLPELSKDVTLTATVSAGSSLNAVLLGVAAGGAALLLGLFLLARRRKNP